MERSLDSRYKELQECSQTRAQGKGSRHTIGARVDRKWCDGVGGSETEEQEDVLS